MKHPVDVHVGQRRWMVGMTQQQLGDSVGIKFQQIQKYETGMNRVSASRLYEISKTLDVTISFFFEGYENDDTVVELPTKHNGSDVSANVMADKEAMVLIRSYYAMPEDQRKRVFDLMRVMSKAS